MYRAAAGLRFSPTDLMVFLGSPFASWMDRWQAEKEAKQLPEAFIRAPIGAGIPDVGPAEVDPADEESKLFQRYGSVHESRFLRSLRDQGLEVVEIVRGSDALEQSLKAIHLGAVYISQAMLESGDLFGYPDFLIRCDGESRLGPFQYEVLDTKLARSTKPGYFSSCAPTRDVGGSPTRRAARSAVRRHRSPSRCRGSRKRTTRL